jgi:hypothetical protein
VRKLSSKQFSVLTRAERSLRVELIDMAFLAGQLIRYADFAAHDWILSQAPEIWRNRVELDFRYVSLNLLEPAESWIHPEIVSRWLLRMRSGRCIPPPVVCMTGYGMLYIHDGNHRFRALEEYCGAAREGAIRVAVATPIAGFTFRCHCFMTHRTFLLGPERAVASTWGLSAPPDRASDGQTG